MKISSVAKNYAKALYELAQEKKMVETILSEYGALMTLIGQNKALCDTLLSPDVAPRNRILNEIFKGQFSNLLINFLKVILKNRRFHLLREIHDDYKVRYDRERHRIRAEVVTAIPLSDVKIAELSQKLGHFLNKEVRVENVVESSLAGGVIVRLNGQVFNASLNDQFKKLKQHLTKYENEI